MAAERDDQKRCTQNGQDEDYPEVISVVVVGFVRHQPCPGAGIAPLILAIIGFGGPFQSQKTRSRRTGVASGLFKVIISGMKSGNGTSHDARGKRKLAEIVKALESEYGRPRIKLEPDPVAMIVHTILSQNTNDRNRDAAFGRVLAEFSDWNELAEASAGKIERVIRTAGLAPAKSKAIKAALAAFKKKFGGLDAIDFKSWPDSEILDFLTSVNGIGVKSAAIFLAFHLGRDVCPVDTHVFRVLTRLGAVSSKGGRDGVYRELAGLVPAGEAGPFHMNVIRHGRAVCAARRPRCSECSLSDLCDYYGKARG